jgi:hypothetical protein
MVTHMMTTAVQMKPHENKIDQAERLFAQLLAEALRRGFHGTAGLTLSVQDGCIQHIRIATEKMIK